MSNPKQQNSIELSARQKQLLANLLENLLDVSTDATVRQDARRLLKKIEASR